MAEDKKKEIDVTVIEVTEEYLKEKLYKIRGKRVLLDADLAEIYGYDTKGFNRQVKNNIEKFDEDFMFELTDEELEDLRYKNCTANISSKSRYNPHVFTEQGLYMLMTVLKGPLAVKQSKALIRTFKKMKDYILENRDLIGQREILQLSMETANNRIEINKINSDMISLEKQISDVAEGLKDVVTKSELADMMNSFVSDDDDKWLVLNASFHQAETIKTRLEQQMDNLDVTDTHYDKKISDLQRRLDAQYDRIDEVEETMTELKSQIYELKKNQIDADNIYGFLGAFNEVYSECTDAEKKQFMQAFIERIDIFQERREDGNWI